MALLGKDGLDALGGAVISLCFYAASELLTDRNTRSPALLPPVESFVSVGACFFFPFLKAREEESEEEMITAVLSRESALQG